MSEICGTVLLSTDTNLELRLSELHLVRLNCNFSSVADKSMWLNKTSSEAEFFFHPCPSTFFSSDSSSNVFSQFMVWL